MIKLVLLLALMLGGNALANEASVKKLLGEKFQGARITTVTKSPYGGLYEVFVDGQIGYTDEQVTFFIIGNLIDTKSGQNVSQQRLRKLTAIDIREIPLDLGIRKVLGNGKRQLIIFSDPMCPFCQQLEKELAGMTDVTIYTMLYPVETKFKGSTELAKQIWCSVDRGKAWDDWMLRRIRPTTKPTCNNPIARLDQIGNKLNINNTPTIIFADGGIIPGMVPRPQIEKMLKETPAK